MRNKTWSYVLAGSAGVLVIVGVGLLRRSLCSTPPAPVGRDIQPTPKVFPADTDSEITAAPAAADRSDQANPPEAGLVGPPVQATEVEKIPPVIIVAEPVEAVASVAPVAPKQAAVQSGWHDPAPVDSKDVPLGPLISPSILVEKSALRLTVFDGDLGVKSYRVAVGAVRGDKQVEGDRKTPEGDFYICIRKTTGQTPYTRSMGLSYPNLEDARRGWRKGLVTRGQYGAIAAAIEGGAKPPWQTQLGGAIMIHGKREGRTGTLGCVALDDADIIELYNRLPLKTPVRIIP